MSRLLTQFPVVPGSYPCFTSSPPPPPVHHRHPPSPTPSTLAAIQDLLQQVQRLQRLLPASPAPRPGTPARASQQSPVRLTTRVQAAMPLRSSAIYPPAPDPVLPDVAAASCLPDPGYPDSLPSPSAPSPFAVDPDHYGNRNPDLEGYDPPSVELRARHRHPPAQGSTYEYFDQTPTHRLLWNAREHRLGPWYYRRAQDPSVWWFPFPNYGILTDDDQYLATALAQLNPAALLTPSHSQNFVKYFPTATRTPASDPTVKFHAYMTQVAGYMHASSFFFASSLSPSPVTSLPLFALSPSPLATSFEPPHLILPLTRIPSLTRSR